MARLRRAVAGALLVLVLASACAEVATPVGTGAAPTALPTISEADRWHVVSDRVIAAPYFWVVVGERIDRAPQLSPDGGHAAYLPTSGGGATNLDRLVVRDLQGGRERDLTPEEGYTYTSVRWSPDSTTLAFVKHLRGRAAEIWRVDPGGSGLAPIFKPEAPDTTGPNIEIVRWTADGRFIELQPALREEGPRRWVSADGSEQVTVLSPSAVFGVSRGALVGEMALSPGRDYALQGIVSSPGPQSPSETASETYSLLLYDFGSQTARELWSPPSLVQVWATSVSPGGAHAAAVVGGERGVLAQIWVMEIVRTGDGFRLAGEPVPAIAPDFVPTSELIWSAAGIGYVLVLPVTAGGSGGILYVVDARAGKSYPLGDGWQFDAVVSVSADARTLLAIRGAWTQAELHLLELVPPAGK